MSKLADRLRASLQTRAEEVRLVAEGVRLTGHEILLWTDRVAKSLEGRGIGAGDVVAVGVDRSVDSIIAILAAIKIGAGYLPLDLRQPVTWLGHLVRTADPRILLMGETARAPFFATSWGSELPCLVVGIDRPGSLLTVDTIPQVQHSPRLRHHDIAYVMGTSGSTGLPKAVPVTTSSLLDYCDAVIDRVGGPAKLDRMQMATVTTLAADLGNTMVFPALLCGATLHVVADDVARDPERYAQYATENRIDALKIVPTHLRALLSAGVSVLPNQLLIVGGETFDFALLDDILSLRPACAIFNHYGPTETTIGVALYAVPSTLSSSATLRATGFRTVPIGTPLGDTKFRVLHEDVNAGAEADAKGELLILGSTVSSGYLGAEADAGTRFFEAENNVRGYRSGDIVRKSADGIIEFVGRADRQIKIRGHRVDIAGVEAALRECDVVREAYVDSVPMLDPLAQPRMIAWVSLRSGNVDDLKAFLTATLPIPMIPQQILVLKQLPRTPNGKIDVRSLPVPIFEAAPTMPGSAVEAVCRCFERVLAIAVEDADANFFSLGGTSLAALRVLALLKDEYSISISVRDFYESPTPRGIASCSRTMTMPAQPVAQVTERGVSRQIASLWTHLQLHPDDGTYVIPLRLAIRAVTNVDAIERAIKSIADRHEALRTRIVTIEGRPSALIDDTPEMTIRFLRTSDSEPKSADIDTSIGPLAIAKISKAAQDSFLLELRVHHFAFDGISVGIFVRELARVLDGQVVESMPRTERSRTVPYSRSVVGPGARARMGLSLRQSNFFQDVARLERRLSESLWARVLACSTKYKTTPFVFSLAAWGLVLSRQDQEPEIAVATAVNLRTPGTEDHLVGYHADLVVVEMDLKHAKTGPELIDAVHARLGRALDERGRPYSELVADQRSATETLPARTVFALEELESAAIGTITVEQLPVFEARPILDVDLTIRLEKKGPVLQLDYRRSVLHDWHADSLSEQLIRVLEQLAEPDYNIRDIVLTSDDTSKLVPQSGGRFQLGTSGPGVNAAECAVTWGSLRWSHAEFDRRVLDVASRLSDYGIGRGHAVSTCISLSPALVVAWHALLRIGAAVVAIDPGWKHRARHILDKARPIAVLSSSNGLDVDIVKVDSPPALYSSEVGHICVLNRGGRMQMTNVLRSDLEAERRWYRDACAINSSDVFLAHSPVGSPQSAWELIHPILWEARLVLAPGNGSMSDLIAKERITIIQAPRRQALEIAREAAHSESLRHLIAFDHIAQNRGESEPRTSSDLGFVQCFYDPNTGVIATCAKGGAPAVATLGRPVFGTKAVVQDDERRAQPKGAWGELIFYRPAQVYGADSSTDATHAPERCLSTGIRARWDGIGALEFGGEIERRVVVRGNRFGLEEIEDELRCITGVSDAYVCLRSLNADEPASLVAFVETADASISAAYIGSHCSRTLPSFMRPAAIAVASTLPRTFDGEIVAGSLDFSALSVAHESSDANTDTERWLGSIWSSLIGRRCEDVNLPFFESGGTSLAIPGLQLHIKQRSGVNLSVAELFTFTTISQQAAAIEAKSSGKAIHAPIAQGRGRLMAAATSNRRNRR